VGSIPLSRGCSRIRGEWKPLQTISCWDRVVTGRREKHSGIRRHSERIDILGLLGIQSGLQSLSSNLVYITERIPGFDRHSLETLPTNQSGRRPRFQSRNLQKKSRGAHPLLSEPGCGDDNTYFAIAILFTLIFPALSDSPSTTTSWPTCSFASV
jgi:hypothetical protein